MLDACAVYPLHFFTPLSRVSTENKWDIVKVLEQTTSDWIRSTGSQVSETLHLRVSAFNASLCMHSLAAVMLWMDNGLV